MITQHHLAQAKAFLCWDRFPDLSVKLIPLKEPVAFYYPPSKNAHTIVVFYAPEKEDLSQVLFLLFHEAGHYVQFRAYQEQRFWEFVHLVEGPEKLCFEQEAWERGADILQEFLRQTDLPEQVLMHAYSHHAEQSVASYNSSL